MQDLQFTKMNGAGNDFIVIDSIKNETVILSPEIIRRLCDRRRGIGADGILHLKPSDKYDYELIYYNSDGFPGSLCANGSRCSIKYACDYIYDNKESITFICDEVIYSGSVLSNDQIRFNLKEPSSIELDLKIDYDDKKITANFLDTGSPHVVIFWKDIEDNFSESFEKFDLVTFGRFIRNSEKFSPNGTNVNVVKVEDNDLFIRTYERGVEDETLSCGTGNVASAVVLNLIKKISSPIIFHSFGGDELTVNFTSLNDKISKITLTGPVKINYIGSCNF